MLKYIKYTFLILAMWPALSQAESKQSYISEYVPDSTIIGQGDFSKFFVTVYSAILYAPNNKYDARKPFALSLTYSMNLKGKDIANRSVQEIRKQGFNDDAKLAEWSKSMVSIFPDVKNGTNITGIYTAQKQTVFYENGKKIGTITDKEFGRKFFDIWLSEKTSEPEFRKKLLDI